MSNNKTVTMPLELAEILRHLDRIDYAAVSQDAFAIKAITAELRALLAGPSCSACNDTRRMHEDGCDPGDCSACAAPAVERQEPFRVLVKSCYGPTSKKIGDADESMRSDIESARQYFGSEKEIDAEKAKGLVYISPGEWFAIPLYTSPPAPVAFDIESAAQKLASCMDYPWEHMPEQGRNSMREHAKAILSAACLDKVKELNQ